MGKIGQNPKIGQFWRTIAPQPYVVQERWPALGNSLALEIQRVNSISLQCIPWPVACSEWGACLTLYRCQILGQMTLKVKIFENVFPDSSMRHQTTFRDQIWWKVYERSRGLPNKKTRAPRDSPQTHFAQNGPLAPKISWTLSPLGDLSTYTEFGPDRLRFPGLIPERLILRPKKSIQYRLLAKSNNK